MGRCIHVKANQLTKSLRLSSNRMRLSTWFKSTTTDCQSKWKRTTMKSYQTSLKGFRASLNLITIWVKSPTLTKRLPWFKSQFTTSRKFWGPKVKKIFRSQNTSTLIKSQNRSSLLREWTSRKLRQTGVTKYLPRSIITLTTPTNMGISRHINWWSKTKTKVERWNMNSLKSDRCVTSI